MKQRKIVLASIPNLVHFLAVFNRAFRIIHHANEDGNRDEMLLGGECSS